MDLVYTIISFSVIKYTFCAFVVQDSGHFPVGVEDVGIRFYLSVLNVMNSNITVMKAADPECCWQVQPGDIDCESMDLFGGYSTNISAGASKNISYVFPNLYPLDRSGMCTFFMKENLDKTVRHVVNFNTTEMETPDGRSIYRELLRPGVYVYRSCSGVDENMRNNCRPFDCTKKYNGFRNFYRQEKGKCEPATRCKTKLGKDKLPTTAFDFEHNRCKNLVSKLGKEEERVIDNMMDESNLSDESKLHDADPLELVIDCNNGIQVGRNCRCNEGWQTVSVTTENDGIIKDWCSKKVSKSEKMYATSKSPNYIIKYALLIILASVSSLLLLYTFILWWRLLFGGIMAKLLYCIRKIWHTRSHKDDHSFSFSYNPLWEIGDQTFNSDKTDADVVTGIEDENKQEQSRRKEEFDDDRSLFDLNMTNSSLLNLISESASNRSSVVELIRQFRAKKSTAALPSDGED